MNNKEIDLRERVLQYDDMAFEAIVGLEKAHMALGELINGYNWDYEPTAQKALKYGSSSSGDIVRSDKEAEFSYKYINDYKKIMWLAEVALDYMDSALKNIQNVYEENVSNA